MRKTLARLYPSDTNQPAPAYRGRHVRRCREHGMTARFLWCSICERNALRGDVYVPKHRAGLSDWDRWANLRPRRVEEIGRLHSFGPYDHNPPATERTNR